MVEVVGKDASMAKQATCRNCSSILKYLPIDVTTVNNGRDISGGASGHDYINCPSCSHKVIVRSWNNTKIQPTIQRSNAMRENDHEYRSFEQYCINHNMDRTQHPLHLLYLNHQTAQALYVFRGGYAAGRKCPDSINVLPADVADQPTVVAAMRDLLTTLNCNSIMEVRDKVLTMQRELQKLKSFTDSITAEVEALNQ